MECRQRWITRFSCKFRVRISAGSDVGYRVYIFTVHQLTCAIAWSRRHFLCDIVQETVEIKQSKVNE